ncbi:xylulokinase [Enterococcus sp. CWB-B31]|uniref:xylulokinase n=1 Tax=Enterococcus sp. CWB-B31 TaxID=2885159 RepID=UPI001E556162|nr:xylulokinase [Enterococcus sp. CWB-B31]MCB5954223.1 xylulokinase [Enterococcus sp. CWB-B31]
MSYVLGLDLGTSSIKGLLMNKAGQIVTSKVCGYPLETPKLGYSEQDPKCWLEATKSVLQEMLYEVPDMAEKLEGISFSGQMHSLVLVDGAGEVLRNAILWNDVRTTEQCRKIMTKMGEKVLKITKNIALEGFTLPKILWVQENEPDIWAKAKKFMLPKDYLAYYLTGAIQMDYSDAAGTLLLDIESKNWSEEMLTAFGLSGDFMPALISSSGFRGKLLPELQETFGFKQEVKIFGGGADNACAALGAGIVSENIGMASIGTSGVFLSYEKNAEKDYQGKLHLFNHVIENACYSMGVTLAAGDSLNWFKTTFAPELSFDELLKEVDTVVPGSDGLLFTPYIVGERTPHVDSKIRGSFIGIDTHHQLKHFARSVLEGITFSLRDSQKLMEHVAGKNFTKIVSVGGGAKNKAWLQMQADVFNTTVVNLTAEQGPGLGAAMLAALGCNWFDTAEECAAAFVHYKDEYQPIPENVQKYKKVYAIYKDVYNATADLTHRLQTIL